jgi:general secretion pathway protein H
MAVMASLGVTAMVPTLPTGIDSRTNKTGRLIDTRGFTLVETLIALSLIALLAAALSPMLMPSPARTISASAGEMVVALRETRRLAQASRAPHQLMVDTAAKRYAITPGDQWRQLPPGTTAEITTAQALARDAARGAIAFFPDGSSSGGRIRLGLDGHVRQIDVAWLTGRIALADSAR